VLLKHGSLLNLASSLAGVFIMS